jgi:two-component system, chemotaxis family, chemotaxis protein CheY
MKNQAMSKRVLIVDDSMLIRKMVGGCLAEDGWEVAGEAVDGHEAVEKFRLLRPDAVTLDIVMPRADGMHALQHILEIDLDAKVVVVSALNQTKMISEAIRRGAQDFIAKPFLPEQLQQTLRHCVAQSAAC